MGKRRRRNPLLATVNPGRRLVPLARHTDAILYRGNLRHGRPSDKWEHELDRKPAPLYGSDMPGRKVVVSRELWKEDGYLHNPPKRRKRRNPGKRGPHVFAKLRRAAVRRGVRDPDAYAEAVKRAITGHNPRGGKVKKRKAHKRRPPRGFKTWKAYMASIRPGHKRRRSTKRRRRALTPARARGSVMHRKRKHHRRHSSAVSHRRGRRRRGFFRRSNPGVMGFVVEGLKDGLIGTAGAATSRAVPAFVGVQPAGYLGLGVQALVGALFGLGVDRFVSHSAGRAWMQGVFQSATSSVVRGFNLPIVSPALGDECELHAMAGYVGGYAPKRIASVPATRSPGGSMSSRAPVSLGDTGGGSQAEFD